MLKSRTNDQVKKTDKEGFFDRININTKEIEGYITCFQIHQTHTPHWSGRGSPDP